MRTNLGLGLAALVAAGILFTGCQSREEPPPMDDTAMEGAIAEPTAADTIYTTTSTSDTSIGDTAMTGTSTAPAGTATTPE